MGESEGIAFAVAAMDIDRGQTAAGIEKAVREQVGSLHRRGIVVGVSGGIDSSVVAALSVRALGAERVRALLMPERDSSPDSLRLGRLVADTLGVTAIVEDITPMLMASGCYEKQAEAVRTVFAEYDDDYRFNLTLPSLLGGSRLNVFELTIEAPSGERKTSRLTVEAYLQLVAATNYKQRIRKMVEYYHGDRLNFAVAGTPNRLEYDQGFFVKQGDGAADIKPIAHLYKTQVYALAEFLGIPQEIRQRPPTTDTFSLAQTQEEFYFSLPYQLMDACLYGRNHGIAPEVLGPTIGLNADQVTRIYRNIDQKRRATRYLHQRALTVEPIGEIDPPAS